MIKCIRIIFNNKSYIAFLDEIELEFIGTIERRLWESWAEFSVYMKASNIKRDLNKYKDAYNFLIKEEKNVKKK